MEKNKIIILIIFLLTSLSSKGSFNSIDSLYASGLKGAV